jgi:predicted RNA-binding protein
MNLEKTHNGGEIAVLLPCSKRRDQDEGKAYEVYAMAAVHKLKQVLNDHEYDENVDTFILSAKYGIIPPDKEIELYDETIDDEIAEDVKQWVGEFLAENDYKVFFSFVDGDYAKAVNEVGRYKNTRWGIDTLMFAPATRTASIDGIDMLDSIIREETDINSAAIADW